MSSDEIIKNPGLPSPPQSVGHPPGLPDPRSGLKMLKMLLPLMALLLLWQRAASLDGLCRECLCAVSKQYRTVSGPGTTNAVFLILRKLHQ